jgi:hypothetical protein
MDVIDDDAIVEACTHDVEDVVFDIDALLIDDPPALAAWHCDVVQRPFLPIANVGLQASEGDVAVTLTLRFPIDATSVRCVAMSHAPMVARRPPCTSGSAVDVAACMIDAQERRASEAL